VKVDRVLEARGQGEVEGKKSVGETRRQVERQGTGWTYCSTRLAFRCAFDQCGTVGSVDCAMLCIHCSSE